VKLFDYCTINISSTITGECLERLRLRVVALSDQIVALAYDERTGEIFTATEEGICCAWSKNFLDAWMQYEDMSE